VTGKQDWSASFAMAPTSAMTFYDEIMVPRMFDPWAELLLDQLQLQNGQTVLDVACGPGTVTRRAALRVGPEGRVVGCDFSPAMLDLARSKVLTGATAPIDYLECPADSLRVADDAFDVITCQQGLQFFPDQPAALAEMRRALRPGGQLGIATWCDIADCPPFAALASAVRRVLGDEIADAYASGPWGFGDAAALARLVNECGFADVNVVRHELPLVFEGGPQQLLLTLLASSAATLIAQLSESSKAALGEAVEEAARSITIDGAVHSFASSNILTATLVDG
jgi:SAM-dependent methyltransferase